MENQSVPALSAGTGKAMLRKLFWDLLLDSGVPIPEGLRLFCLNAEAKDK